MRSPNRLGGLGALNLVSPYRENTDLKSRWMASSVEMSDEKDLQYELSGSSARNACRTLFATIGCPTQSMTESELSKSSGREKWVKRRQYRTLKCSSAHSVYLCSVLVRHGTRTSIQIPVTEMC